jgi:type II secretion system protein I
LNPSITRFGFGRSAIRSTRRHRPRAGLSLLEIIIATAIVSVSVTLLLRVIDNTHRIATRARDRVTAQLLCQNKLNEIIIGIHPLQSVAGEAFAENPQWRYTLQVEDSQLGPLKNLTIEVFGPIHPGQSQSPTNPVLNRSRYSGAEGQPPAYRMRRILRPIQPARKGLNLSDADSLIRFGEGA